MSLDSILKLAYWIYGGALVPGASEHTGKTFWSLMYREEHRAGPQQIGYVVYDPNKENFFVHWEIQNPNIFPDLESAKFAVERYAESLGYRVMTEREGNLL